MNREVEFRGFDSREWRYGDLEYNRKDDVARIHTYKDDGSYNKQYLVDPYTVGQFTGLLDKNGKKIFEGDIISLGKNKTYTAQIVYRNDSLRIYSVGGCYIGDLEYIRLCGIDYCEVIGNIYDNPELLDKK